MKKEFELQELLERKNIADLGCAGTFYAESIEGEGDDWVAYGTHEYVKDGKNISEETVLEFHVDGSVYPDATENLTAGEIFTSEWDDCAV